LHSAKFKVLKAEKADKKRVAPEHSAFSVPSKKIFSHSRKARYKTGKNNIAIIGKNSFLGNK